MTKLLDDGLDELAANAHQGLPLRCLVMFAVAAIATTMLPWKVCLAWAGLMSAGECWSWFATRTQFKGLRASPMRRLSHLGNLVAVSGGWMLLGWMLWTAGGPEGGVCAVTIWLSVIFFAQTFAYQSPIGFIVAGAAPGAGMLVAVLTSPNPLHLRLGPVSAVLMLALAFAGDGVMRMLAARRRFAESQRQVMENEARYRVLADNVTDVIALNALDGQRLYTSPSVEQALGYTAEELGAATPYDYLHPDDQGALRRAISALVSRGGQETVEYRVIRKDGVTVWVESSFTLAEGGPDGGPAQVVSVSRLIDARKELESDLFDALELAEGAAAAKSDFLANMTHELRTPLNAIVGFSGLLKASNELGPTDARHARLVHDASATLLEIVNSVLDFSKLEAGAVEVDPQPFDPVEEALAVVALVSEQAKTKGLRLSVRAEGGGTHLLGDAPRIRQVLLNFLSNALKFTSRGGVELGVIQTPGADGRRLRLEVRDTGIGVPADQLASVFDRFTQGDVSVSRRFGGTGLGLAISKRIVELMGGRIGVDTVEGEGSTFWFELELEPATGAAAIVEAEPEAAELDRPLRLLLVEDVAVNRELVQALLRPFDIEIDTAEDGVHALAAVEHNRYDLILMDVQMPVMDGLTAARRIRAMGAPHLLATPIVAMTANVLPEQVRKCLEAGMNDHIGKPISPARLLDVIARWTGPQPEQGADDASDRAVS